MFAHFFLVKYTKTKKNTTKNKKKRKNTIDFISLFTNFILLYLHTDCHLL